MKNINIRLIIATIFIIMVAIIGSYYFKEKTPPSSETQEITQNTEINKETVETYIRDNISTLSPEEAVLGGTFYVTKINFIDNSSAIVSYEDGHIALEAKAVFYINEGQVFIDSFELLKE